MLGASPKPRPPEHLRLLLQPLPSENTRLQQDVQVWSRAVRHWGNGEHVRREPVLVEMFDTSEWYTWMIYRFMIQVCDTGVWYRCMLHVYDTGVWYTQVYDTGVWYRCLIHSDIWYRCIIQVYVTGVLYRCMIQVHFTSVLLIPVLMCIIFFWERETILMEV